METGYCHIIQNPIDRYSLTFIQHGEVKYPFGFL